MTMWLATYSQPAAANGRGISIVSTERMPEFVLHHPDVEFRLYSADECPVFTPAVVAAFIGNSPSL